MDTKIKIMIVEDDEVLAKEIAIFLAKWQYEAIEVKRFENITEEYTKVRPQLILMDINLPYFDGFYWCNQITKKISPVWIISARSRLISTLFFRKVRRMTSRSKCSSLTVTEKLLLKVPG